MSIFRAYDIRGIYPADLNEEIMENIGKAVGTLMIRNNMGNEFLIGNDIRASSGDLSESFIKGITSMGINVTNVRTTSFGVALFAGWKLKKDVTGYITASHNPPDWNGIKFYDKNCIGFFEEVNSEIGRIVKENDYETYDGEKGKVETIDMKSNYISHLINSFSISRKLKVVVDCGEGSTSLVAPEVFESFENIEVVKLFCDVNPNFSGRGADVEEENLKKLREKVLEEKADFGFGFDGDGDRVGIVDDKGNILTGDQIAVMVAKGLLSGKKEIIISNVECSMILEEQLEPLNAQVIRIPVGHTFMMQEVKEKDAVFGAESSKHFVIPSYFPFDDAVIIPLKIAESISKSNEKLSDIADKIPVYPKKRIGFDCADETKFKVVDSLKEKLSKEYEKTNTLDGVRVDLETGWVLIRASNTSPQIRLTAEADSEENLKTILEKFSGILKEGIEHCS